MLIHNNSDIKFNIVLKIDGKSYLTVLDERVRTTAETIFSLATKTTTPTLPRYIGLKVLHNEVVILDRPCIETNTHIGCVFSRNTPKAFVSFEKDLSDESSQPTDEMIRLVADLMQKYQETYPLFFSPREEFSSDDDYINHLHECVFCFANADFHTHMRQSQMLNAIRLLFCPI
ncbi:MAG: hypothetical protein WCG10_07140 [Chlamydiota bacterium]